MEIGYKPSFVRQMHALPQELQAEALARIEEFKKTANHKRLRVHPLKGTLKGLYSFSVNYRYRIVFVWEGKRPPLAALIAIGDHDVYR
jgi:plasmid maintenance system killer protein